MFNVLGKGGIFCLYGIYYIILNIDFMFLVEIYSSGLKDLLVFVNRFYLVFIILVFRLKVFKM